MRPLFAICLATALSTPLVAGAEGKSIIVLDASGSMWGQIDGRAKLEIAREALGSVLAGIDPATEIGLIAYGHREKGSCADIELVVPPAAGTAQAITDAANAMKFLGKTPLTESVRQAAAELRSTEEKATVILITDGIETCEADPCALGAELEASGVDFTAHVVGFGLTEEEGRAVACLAENTGGQYIQASDAGGLVDALKTTVAVAEPEPVPPPAPAALAENVDPVLRLVAGGEEVTDGVLSDAYFDFLPLADDGTVGETAATIYGASRGLLAPGRYLMRTKLHAAEVEQEVVIASASELSQPEAVLDAGILALTLLEEAGGDPAADAAWEARGAGGVSDYGYAQTFRVFPSGEYEVVATLGEVVVKEALVITAGEVTERTIVLGPGIPVFTAYYAEGVPVEGDQSFDVYEAKPGLDGRRKGVRTDYGAGSAPKLAPGDYVVIGQVQEATAEVAFTVKAGERIEVPVILNAGIAAITAPNAQGMDLFEGKVGLDGKRKQVRSDYGDAWQLTLPAGDYLAEVRVDEARAEAAFTVKAAERTELTITLVAGVAAIIAPGATEIEIFEAKPGLDGKRASIRSDYGEEVVKFLPPGDYVATARAGLATAETAFTVTDAARVEVQVTIPRGFAVISAAGAREISIYDAKAGLDGNRPYLRSDYGERSENILPPGDYVAVVDFGEGVTAEAAFSLADGASVEVPVVRP